MATILIVDDDAALRRVIATTLEDLGHAVAEAADCEAALAWMSARSVDAVLLDLRMPGMDGMEVLRRIRARKDAPPVAVLTAVPTGNNTIEAMRLGAAYHLAKPIGCAGLRDLLERMLPKSTRAPTAAGSPDSSARDSELVGSNAAMREVQKAVWLLADSNVTVLLLGKTGTGKELVARAIHRHDLRSHSRRTAGKPAVRPCQGRLHRRDGRPARLVPRGAGRHAVSGRDRRHEPCDAGQAAACSAGAEASLEGNYWQPMEVAVGGDGTWTTSFCAPADFVRVRARDGRGRTDEEQVEPLLTVMRQPVRFADGSDRGAVGAWPEKGIFGTQLGPNRNVRKW